MAYNTETSLINPIQGPVSIWSMVHDRSDLESLATELRRAMSSRFVREVDPRTDSGVARCRGYAAGVLGSVMGQLTVVKSEPIPDSLP